MASEEQTTPQSEIETLEMRKEITPIKANIPKPPKGMSESESVRVQEQALTLVKQLGEAGGSKEMELLDNMTSLGVQSQRTASSNLDLLRARVSGYLSEGGPSKEIANSMLDLRVALDRIDPHAAPKSVWGKLNNLVPIFGRHNPVRVLQKIAIRYEPVSRQITTIETRLREGHTLLIRDNVELRKLYEQLEAQQPVVQRNTYLGELLMLELEKLIQQTPDPMKRERIRAALHDVTIRVQDLRTMEEVHLQYFVSIEMSRQNNNRLGQAIERTLTLATNVVTVGLAIQSALVRQRSISDATRRTREFLGTVVTANAAAIKIHTREIGDLYSNPVIAIDKITQAHNDLIEAMDTADQLRQEGIQTAKENISKLTELSTVLMQRVSGLLEQNEKPKSKTEMLSSGELEAN